MVPKSCSRMRGLFAGASRVLRVFDEVPKRIGCDSQPFRGSVGNMDMGVGMGEARSLRPGRLPLRSPVRQR